MNSIHFTQSKKMLLFGFTHLNQFALYLIHIQISNNFFFAIIDYWIQLVHLS